MISTVSKASFQCRIDATNRERDAPKLPFTNLKTVSTNVRTENEMEGRRIYKLLETKIQMSEINLRSFL